MEEWINEQVEKLENWDTKWIKIVQAIKPILFSEVILTVKMCRNEMAQFDF